MLTRLFTENKDRGWEDLSRQILKRSVIGVIAALVLCLFVPIYAQTTAATAKSTPRPRYDITKEVTLTGSVSSVVKKPTREMHLMPGSHLMVTISSGTVDANLGRYAMRGKGALAVSAGQHVQLTGVLMTVGDKEVFVARLVQTNGHIYKIRNEHGFAYAPAARKDSAKSESKGESL